MIFRTKNKLLCAGPVDLQEGDEVQVLSGLSKLVVLRPKLGKCQYVKTRDFVDIAHVHRVMRGEVTGSSFPKENFVLQ